MDKALDSLYNLSSTKEDLEQNWKHNQDLSKVITSKYELDNIDKTICWVAGILAGLTDAFFVTDIRNLSKVNKTKLLNDSDSIHLNKSGTINSWIDDRIKNLYSSEKVSELEKCFKVPYDASIDKDVLGLNPKTHRLQSFGHDPILGFYYGVKDILMGTFTAVDNNGDVITKVVEGFDNAGIDLFKAIAIQFGHLKSDITTPAGLPMPFMSQLMKIKGNSDINGFTYNRLFKNMYLKGYNFNHLISMGIPALIIEVIVRISYLGRQLCNGESFTQAIPINKPKLDKMLFYSYLIASGCNGVKIIASNGNVFAFNPVLWGMTLRYGISEFKRYIKNEKEKKRHEYVISIYNQHINELNLQIEQDLDFYNYKL